MNSDSSSTEVYSQISLVFNLISFYQRISGSHVIFSFHVSLGSSGVVTISQAFPFSDDLDSFEEYWSRILYSARILDLSGVFLTVRLGLCVLGRKNHSGQGSLSSHHITLHMTYHCWCDFDHLAEVCLSGVSTMKLLSPPPLFSCCTLESQRTAHT